MLIVVVIIGILAAALIPRLTSVKDKADDSARKANLQQLVTAMASYAMDNGVYPSSSTGSESSGLQVALTKGWMKSVPLDPTNQSGTIMGAFTNGYTYFSTYKGGTKDNGFVFISRAETAWAANWVECTATNWYFTGGQDIDTLRLCDKVTLDPSGNTANCAYSNTGSCVAWQPSQLRIVSKY